MDARIVKNGDKIYFKSPESFKILDVLQFNTDSKNNNTIIQIIDLPSDDKIDSYLDNFSYVNNDFIVNVEPDSLLEVQFSLPHRCWFPHGEDDSNPAINKIGSFNLIKNDGLDYLLVRDQNSFPLDIFVRRKYVTNSVQPIVNIVSGTNGSGKTSLLKKLAIQEANIRPTIIICDSGMVSQFKDISSTTFIFGKDLFHPKIASPLYFSEAEFDSAVNAYFGNFLFRKI
jgi:hypothetical protein